MHIKVKTRENHNWHIFEKGFATKVELRKRLNELDKLTDHIDLFDSKNSHFVCEPQSAMQSIKKEVEKQETKYGYTDEFIDSSPHYYDNEQLSYAAEMLLAAEHEEGIDPYSYPDGWPEEDCRKMLSKPYKERLIISAALLVREIDRCQRCDNKRLETSLVEDLS